MSGRELAGLMGLADGQAELRRVRPQLATVLDGARDGGHRKSVNHRHVTSWEVPAMTPGWKQRLRAFPERWGTLVGRTHLPPGHLGDRRT